jgi:hypothetical protein
VKERLAEFYLMFVGKVHHFGKNNLVEFKSRGFNFDEFKSGGLFVIQLCIFKGGGGHSWSSYITENGT